jgi:hypothetical protein
MTTALSARHGIVRVETCAGSWLVDMRRRRFCRVERGTPVTFVPPPAWRAFHALQLGGGGVVRLVLDERARSAVSGWLHTDDCVRCAQAARRLA